MHSQEPVGKGSFRAMAEELARDINRHATVVLAGPGSLARQVQPGQAGPSQSSAAAAAPSGSLVACVLPTAPVGGCNPCAEVLEAALAPGGGRGGEWDR